MKNISLLELARLAGVSKTTASLILNGKSDRYKISTVTKSRVLRIATENSYKPNVLARNLSLGKSMTVGVIMTGLEEPGNSELIESIEKKLIDQGYQLVIGFTTGDAEKRIRLVAEMLERRVDGILFVLSDGEVVEIENEDIPVVSVGRNVEDLPAVCIDVDAGIRKLIGYWYPRGKRSIGYVGLSGKNEDCKNSYRENYIERFTMQADHMFLLKKDNDYEKMKRALLALVTKGVNAILFETSGLTYLALKVAKELSDHALNDISFGSYGYHPAFDVAAKDIVYIKLPYDLLTEKAVGLLMNLIKNQNEIISDFMIEPELKS